MTVLNKVPLGLMVLLQVSMDLPPSLMRNMLS